MASLEKEIISKIRQSDEKAFEYVFKSYYSLLCTYAYDLLKDDDIAEEVVQEVLIRFWENRFSIEISVSLKSYLYRSVHNQCVNLVKHLKVLKRLSDKYSENMQMHASLMCSPDDEPLDSYFYEGIEEDIEKAISQLPDQCCTVFKMSRFEMLSHNAIASKLNISVNTVKTHITRALEKIRNEVSIPRNKA